MFVLNELSFVGFFVFRDFGCWFLDYGLDLWLSELIHRMSYFLTIEFIDPFCFSFFQLMRGRGGLRRT